MLDSTVIANNLAVVRQQMAAASARAGRDPAAVHLVAVSKGQPAAAIEAAYLAGQRDFGENYVQEWQQKAETLAHLTDLRWHMLGHLQRNKVRFIVGKVHLLHCVDDMQGLDEMARHAYSHKVSQDVLLQVNLAEEQQKRGCGADDAELFVDVLLRSPGLKLRGLMLLPPAQEQADNGRVWFARLRTLADQLAQKYGKHPRLPAPGQWTLSMGMSGDYEVAIEEGATLVRVGTALFGPRGQVPVAPAVPGPTETRT
jgi:pyridoxal phosphate enzyme (YggS family)